MKFDDSDIKNGYFKITGPPEGTWDLSSVIAEIPLVNKDSTVSFVFHEVGCSLGNKAGQVDRLRQDFLYTWAKSVKPYGYDMPKIVRVVTRYDDRDINIGMRRYGFDMDLRHYSFPPSFFEEMPQQVIDEIETSIGKSNGSGLWRRIVSENDPSLLEQIIKKARHDQRLSYFRGYVAESLAQWVVGEYVPEELSFFKNVEIDLLNRQKGHYNKELDILGVTYDPAMTMAKWSSNLTCLDMLMVNSIY